MAARSTSQAECPVSEVNDRQLRANAQSHTGE
jgi:hypothetical protein